MTEAFWAGERRLRIEPPIPSPIGRTTGTGTCLGSAVRARHSGQHDSPEAAMAAGRRYCPGRRSFAWVGAPKGPGHVAFPARVLNAQARNRDWPDCVRVTATRSGGRLILRPVASSTCWRCCQPAATHRVAPSRDARRFKRSKSHFPVFPATSGRRSVFAFWNRKAWRKRPPSWTARLTQSAASFTERNVRFATPSDDRLSGLPRSEDLLPTLTGNAVKHFLFVGPHLCGLCHPRTA